MNLRQLTRAGCRALLPALWCMWAAGAANAQPLAPAAVQPPARVDVGLRGSVIATAQVKSHTECLSQCQRAGGCTGWNFAAGAWMPPRSEAGGMLAPQSSNCTLFTGTLADQAMKSVVSCRMPCTTNGATTPVAPQPGVATLQPPGGSTLRPSTTPLLPGANAGGTSDPSTVVPAAPPLLSGGTYTPPARPPKNTGAPAPAPVPAPAPAPVARSGVLGYEVVFGPFVQVPPLSHTTASAQCPAGKVALSAGYEFTAGGDASFGLEVRGAMPEGRDTRVLMRNANLAVGAQARALAVCVNTIAGLRVVDFDGGVIGGTSGIISDKRLACAAGERVVGGGVMGGLNTMLGANAPSGSAGDSVWWARALSSSPLPGSASAPMRALCAPEALVDGWELVQSAPVALAARTQTTLTQTCPNDKALLAAGLVQSTNNLLDMVANTLAPQKNTLAWQSHLHNRNVLGTGGPVNAVMTAVCAKRV
jgi:hypothetical protein